VSATLYTIIGLIIAAIGTIGYPMWVNRKKEKTTLTVQDSLDSRSVAAMFKDERDRLQRRIDVMAAAHEQQIRAVRAEAESALSKVEASWKAQYSHDQAQIADLRAEVQGLYRQLYQQRPGS
jgi:phage regulator Rha-like protein